MELHPLVVQLLERRGIVGEAAQQAFLQPSYDAKHDPFLLPDMQAAVDRLVAARSAQERIVIYGDYDIDGLTATTVLLEAFAAFGFKNVDAFIPNRFVEGYGLTVDAIERIAAMGAQLIVTVDCGSLSHTEIERANELGMAVIVTDHHNVAEVQPPAVAVINPKRNDHQYPFIDLAGVGVAFKLVQALQLYIDGLPLGQEKWLLDLVALGTVCDVVSLKDENRVMVYWGLQVLKKTRRPGLRALMAIAGVKQSEVNARALGFGLGPRMNAAGRLDTAQLSLDLLTTKDPEEALRLAQQLDAMNAQRRLEQNRIFEEAQKQAEQFKDHPVLVVSDPGWSHGIIGIVAAKLLEKYKKPTFVLQEIDHTAKGSARSYGDFSAADAIRASEAHILKGGGHKAAAGVTLLKDKITDFRRSVNDYYHSLELQDQIHHLSPKEELVLEELHHLDEALLRALEALEPFGQGNTEPIFQLHDMLVLSVRRMGDAEQHVKLQLQDKHNRALSVLAFSAPDHFFVPVGARVHAWCTVAVNEWRGARTIEGRLLELTLAN
ncbi:MAG TPA: single-stranded-DNA-specific exonuclease RecJ [Verrucomicrobiae bacterium]|nr:single-stranded-DNA-specific exonuclease RecJ [Verrucomicrobiae bacterium]